MATSRATPPITPPAMAPAWWLWCVDAAETGNAPAVADDGLEELDILGDGVDDVLSGVDESVVVGESVGVGVAPVPVDAGVGEVVEEVGEPVGASVGVSVGVEVLGRGKMLSGKVGGKKVPGSETVGGVRSGMVGSIGGICAGSDH